LAATIKEWRDNGLIRFFDHKSKRSLTGLVSYMRFSEAGIDSGTVLRLLNRALDEVAEADARNRETGKCQWFVTCGNLATAHVEHPVLGKVPTCARCAAKAAL